jgi:anti-sigma factor ChrR (cupin superfamily)
MFGCCYSCNYCGFLLAMWRWRTKGDEIDGIEGNNDDQHAIAMLFCSLVDTSEQRT